RPERDAAHQSHAGAARCRRSRNDRGAGRTVHLVHRRERVVPSSQRSMAGCGGCRRGRAVRGGDRPPRPCAREPTIMTAMKRVSSALTLLVAAAALTIRAQNARPKPFTVVEATIPELRAAMEQKRVTSRQIVQQYLMRVATYEDRLHAAITVNPKALEL